MELRFLSTLFTKSHNTTSIIAGVLDYRWLHKSCSHSPLHVSLLIVSYCAFAVRTLEVSQRIRYFPDIWWSVRPRHENAESSALPNTVMWLTTLFCTNLLPEILNSTKHHLSCQTLILITLPSISYMYLKLTQTPFPTKTACIAYSTS